MCGFAVLLRARGGGPPLRAPDPRVDAALGRRGPDHTAHCAEPDAFAVATRLTHWEEGAGVQPLTDDAGGLAVFNGELFNLAELQEGLGLGDCSEIEVLLAGIRAHGPEFARRVDGQFAAVVRVGANGPAYAVRDRFGVCPLYLAQTPGAVTLASNLEALAALSGLDAPYSAAGLGAILADWAPTGELTPYAGVAQVPAGGAVRIDDGRLSRTWRWADDLRPSPSGAAAGAAPVDDAAITDLQERLREAIRVRLRSTTPVTCLLSGGIDSTVIGAIAAQEGADTGMGLYLSGDDLVRDRQRQVAAAVGLDLVQHEVRPEAAVTLLEEYVHTRRIPLVRLGPVGMMALAKRARAEGVRAVLSGEGADELFCGYDSYRIIAARAGAFGTPSSLTWADFGTPEFGAERGPRWARAYWRGIVALSPTAGLRRADIMAPVAGLFRPGVYDDLTAAAAAAQTGEPDASGADPDALAARREDDLSRLLASYLLTVQGDHAWMEEAVELRPPFLSAPVARWALSRDPAQLVEIGAGKTPIRRLLRRLADDRPALADLDFAKAAFRVDASFLLRDPEAGSRLRDLAARCPDDLLDVPAVLARLDGSRAAGTCGEAESMLFLLAASLGVLADKPRPVS